MKKNLCLLLLLIAAYSTLNCMEKAPAQQSMNSAPERRASTGRRLSLTGRSMAQIAPMPIPDNNTGPAGAGVGVGAGEGLVHPTLVHQDAVRGAAPQGPLPQPITQKEAEALATEADRNLAWLAGGAAWEQAYLPGFNVFSDEFTTATTAEKERRKKEFQEAGNVAAALAANTHPADSKPKQAQAPMKVKSRTAGLYEYIYSVLGYGFLPFAKDLVILAPGSDITTPAQIHQGQEGESTYYTLHQHNGVLYAVKRGPVNRYIVTLNGLRQLTEAELLGVYGKYTDQTIISYQKLYTVNQILTRADEVHENSRYGVSMKILGQAPYTLYSHKGVMYAFQDSDKAKFQKALKAFQKKGAQDDGTLFSFLLFSRILHTRLDILQDPTGIQFKANIKPWYECC
ncbi:MAG: hypothetical protein WCJ17_04010 [bacterium]